jgi:NAD(P)-dependent dehydrogenase (short-subunit alcohol dehydrogenase family)
LVYIEIEPRLYFMIQARTDMKELQGQTVVVIGGTSGIGLETARQAGAAGAELVLVARPADVAALAIGVMRNGAITGATLDIDGGQQLVVT